jgi:hypothetical protein
MKLTITISDIDHMKADLHMVTAAGFQSEADLVIS